MHHTELIFSLMGLMETKRSTTAFINGSPGSGKTILLQHLAQNIPQVSKQTRILGPYPSSTFQSFTSSLVNDFRELFFLESEIPEDNLLDIISTFDWLKKNIQAPSRQNFVIMIDLEYESLDIDAIRSWFSSIRSLEDRWEDGPARILIIVASYWNHNLLENYYRDIRLSYPYTLGHNYYLWNGISLKQMDEIIQNSFPINQSFVPFGPLLHEVTGGHPGAAIEIINTMRKNQQYTISSLIEAMKKVSFDGQTTSKFVKTWKQLPSKTQSVLRHLLSGYLIPTSNLWPYLDSLCSAGLIREVSIVGKNYGTLYSWFIECVLRNHLKDLEVANSKLALIEINDLIPPLNSINKEAYRIINEIENLIRNFATIRLSEMRTSNGSLLVSRVKKYDSLQEKFLDAYDRALNWKQNSKNAGLPVELNPDIAYLSIKDLATLIAELANELHSKEWGKISEALQTTGNIRNAVMHNQLIDDTAFNQLFNLRAEIFEALKPVQFNL